MLGEPPQLRHGDAGQRNGPDRVGPGLQATELTDQVGRGASRASVVPQQSLSYNIPVLVEGHHPVLLAGDGDGARRRAARRRSPPRRRPTTQPGRPPCRPGATPSPRGRSHRSGRRTRRPSWTASRSRPQRPARRRGLRSWSESAVVGRGPHAEAASRSSVTRAPTSWSEPSQRVYASANRSLAASSPNSCSSWTKASGSSFCRAAAA